MAVKTADEIRDEFLAFFRGKEHAIVPSASVVPSDDPTLLFTNAGMNQFKDVFLGTGSRPYTRAADTQKCIRAGGKHNDLDDVGRDTYHHTFFEMLGNWSFGDYFKREAIAWAWELLTEVWGLDRSRLHVTYFEGDAAEGLEADTEARDLWMSNTDIDPSHIHPGNKKDNFWEMGDTGPCGPCSEIHIDLTDDGSGGSLVNAGDARVIEIWNLVFIQFNRAADGKLSPLPARHVDTGMGFERITAVLQGTRSNYDTDIFAPIFAGIREVTGAPAYTGLLESDMGKTTDAARQQLMIDVSYRVIADHVRCLTFALTDGAMPSNEGRGYVLRRILRRAVRYGRQYLNMREPFLHRLVPVVVDAMGSAFPELREPPTLGFVAGVIRDEEASFHKTLDRGIALFEDAAQRALSSGRIISGEDAFKLHDTYGFPIDLTQIMAEERGLRVDVPKYELLMEQARKAARQASKPAVNPMFYRILEGVRGESTFVGHSWPVDVESKLTTILTPDGTGELREAKTVETNEEAWLVLDRTPFYPEQGGQVGDKGEIFGAGGPQGEWLFEVDDTQRIDRTILHHGRCVRGTIRIHLPSAATTGGGSSTPCLAVVNPASRRPTMQNHTATHVMNWALREVLGDHVEQKGSLVDPEKTRFDLSHPKPISPEEIERIETLCNAQIEQGLTVYDKVVPQADALKINGLRAVFGEKYPDQVRVVSIGVPVDDLLSNPGNAAWRQYSIEFCGGTHVKTTGEIERFVLVTEEAVAKGVRRVVGISGEAAARAVEQGRRLQERAEQIRQGPPDQVPAGVAELQKALAEATIPVRDRAALREAMNELQRIAKEQKKQEVSAAAGVVKDARRQLLDGAERVDGSAIVVGELPEVPVAQVREAADWLRSQAGSAAVCLATTNDGKPLLIAAMTEDLVKKGLKAGDLIKHIVPAIEGRGGGKPDLAQAGGTNPQGIPDALKAAAEWIRQKLN